jgi:hypothetical protein
LHTVSTLGLGTCASPQMHTVTPLPPASTHPPPQTIGALDEKKREALEKTWRKVTTDFGAIFSTLLPGTTAKLEPLEGCSFMDGESLKGRVGGVLEVHWGAVRCSPAAALAACCICGST